MKSAAIRIFITAIFVGTLAAQTTAVHLWAVSDGVRVNPITGSIYEQRSDIHKDYPTGDFRVGNSVWDAATKTISLKAARNEFVAFQVIVDASMPITSM